MISFVSHQPRGTSTVADQPVGPGAARTPVIPDRETLGRLVELARTTDPASALAEPAAVVGWWDQRADQPGTGTWATALRWMGGSDTYLGYVIVKTRRHTSGVADLARLEAQAAGVWVTQMPRALTAVIQAEHVYAFVLGD
ncbi:MAG TPA: hypothetical protein VFA49_09775, partial [Chloroflexota bacterium]|nr:hypothetical protein [Chloroflexota bacterium]